MSFLAGFLLPGLSFGLAAGISPGPLLTLVISETLSGGWRRGIRIALAPVLADGPIVVAAVLLLSVAARMDFFLGVISLAGALFLLYIGYESLRTSRGIDIAAIDAQRASGGVQNGNALMKGVITNYLNPAPYVFHFTVAGPIIARAIAEGKTVAALVFLAGFFFAIVGVKVIIALIIDRSRTLLSGMTYVWLMRALGVLLVWFAIQNAIAGVTYLLRV